MSTAAQNALKPSFNAKIALLPAEDEEEYKQFVRGLFDVWNPEDQAERAHACPTQSPQQHQPSHPPGRSGNTPPPSTN
jgi:hypothetical protein